ncbi:hypothetical protein DYB34_012979 [Aphanomyces astaci]|uniref:Uncharacterized protein n=1 Tax=Aphanomyces astaci TaxID=112090 RepID=A0A3R6XCG6_APHAT|nr:hypothetical protein DYB34_012979 [Aphanomyces astaci]
MHAVHQPSLVSLVVEPLQGPLRQGTWTEAEVAYVALLSKFFKAGLLECVEPGHSIRKWLASIIKCDPMRISKRLTKSARLGIVPYKRNQPSLDAMSSFERRACLQALEAARLAVETDLQSRSTSLDWNAVRCRVRSRRHRKYMQPTLCGVIDSLLEDLEMPLISLNALRLSSPLHEEQAVDDKMAMCYEESAIVHCSDVVEADSCMMEVVGCGVSQPLDACVFDGSSAWLGHPVGFCGFDGEQDRYEL